MEVIIVNIIRLLQTNYLDAIYHVMTHVKRLCDLTVKEVATMFGVGSCGVEGWACNWVSVKMERDKSISKKVAEIMNENFKQKI